jgi:hypothetical protein
LIIDLDNRVLFQKIRNAKKRKEKYKCPEDFKSVEDVRRWRRTRHSSLTLKSFISRLGVLSSDFRQTLSPHSASESGLDSLARAAELRLAADRNGAESDEPQDGSNSDHHDMGLINIPPRHDPSPSAEGDLLLPLRTLYEAANAAAENSNSFDNGINGANEVNSRKCQKRRRPSGEVAEDAGPDGAEADEVESGAEDGWQHLGWEGELPFTLQVRGQARRCLTA